MIRDTSLEAFFNNETNIGIWRSQIFDFLKGNFPQCYSTEDLCYILQISECNGQPRTRELSRCDRNLIVAAGKTINSKGNTVTAWQYNPEPKPKPFIPRAVGDKKLRRKLWEAVFEMRLHRNAHTIFNVARAGAKWALNLAGFKGKEQIRVVV